MSAFMMPSETTAIIAQYLGEAAWAAGHCGLLVGVKTIPPSTRMIEILRGRGCYDPGKDCYDIEKIYNIMTKVNVNSLKERYGEASGEVDPYADVNIGLVDLTDSNRKTWLANLWTVTRCYLYQCDYATSGEDIEFVREMANWVDRMTSELAQMTVDKVRPKGMANYKPWDMF